MFRSVGGVFGTAGIILALSHYQDKVTGMQTIFFVLGFLILAAVPMVFFIPDFARQRYVEDRGRRRRETTPAS